MKKMYFISVPMTGRTEQEIKADCKRAAKAITEKEGKLVERWWTYYGDDDLRRIKRSGFNPGIYCLSNALHRMAECSHAYFCKGWENSNGCRIEHEVAERYGLKIVYEGEEK